LKRVNYFPGSKVSVKYVKLVIDLQLNRLKQEFRYVHILLHKLSISRGR